MKYMLQNKLMTLIVLVIIGLFFFNFKTANAQYVFSCDNRYDADVKVYVVDNRYDADLIVYKVSNRYDVEGNKGLWYFVDNRYDADKKIFFVDNRYDADLLIFFADNRYDAEWRNKSKMYLMF